MDRSTTSSATPQWTVDELLEPPSYSLRNAFRTIGPGAILLAGPIGGGKWLAGPAIAVRYGVTVFLATAAIFLQLVFNLEAIRYTLYAGEPALSGIMRLKPGRRFWAAIYIFLSVAQVGMPAMAASCASTIFAAFANRMPVAADAHTTGWLAYGVMAFTVVILLFGGTFERVLEYASWAMIVFIFTFLVAVNIIFVPAARWVETLIGFFQVG